MWYGSQLHCCSLRATQNNCLRNCDIVIWKPITLLQLKGNSKWLPKKKKIQVLWSFLINCWFIAFAHNIHQKVLILKNDTCLWYQTPFWWSMAWPSIWKVTRPNKPPILIRSRSCRTKLWQLNVGVACLLLTNFTSIIVISLKQPETEFFNKST